MGNFFLISHVYVFKAVVGKYRVECEAFLLLVSILQELL